jgi:hypothetical protein
MNVEHSIPPLRDLPPGRLAALRQQLLAEITRADRSTRPERGRLHRIPLLVTVGASAAAAVTVLMVAWPFHGSPTVLAQAAAAIGNRQVTHVVMDYGLGNSVVDLGTGTRTPVHGRSELWYDPQRGLLQIDSFRGQPAGTFYSRPNANEFQQDWTKGFVSGYKAALQSGDFHVTGTGVVDGRSVYWIESKPFPRIPYPHTRVEQVAISKTTYKPVYIRTRLDGHIEPGDASHILMIETIAPNPALFPKHISVPTEVAPLGSSQTTLTQAQTAMRRPALVPSTTIVGLRRTWIGESGYFVGASPSYNNQLPGIELYYGSLDPSGYAPPYRAPYISITEFPSRNAFVVQQGLGYFPGDNHAVLDNATATLKTHGLYVVIEASDPARAIAAAQALARR